MMQSVGISVNGSTNAVSACGKQEHVALVDRLPAADAGAVEAEAFFEDFFFELRYGNREVLPDAREVHEPQIDGLDVAFTTHRQNRLRCHSHDPMSPNARRKGKVFTGE